MKDCIKNSSVKNFATIHKEIRKNLKKMLYVNYDPEDELELTFFWSFLVYNRNTLEKYLFDKKISYEMHLLEYYKKSPFAYVFVHHELKTVVIGLRGTYNMRDLVSIKQIRDTKKFVPREFAASRNFVDYVTRLYHEIHPGILTHANIDFEMILSVLKKPVTKKYAIHVHGHSLGAACAVLVSEFLVKMGFENVHCRCLSSPQIFPSTFKSDKFTYKHFYTERDIVTTTLHKYFNKWDLYHATDTSRNILLPLPPLDIFDANYVRRNIVAHSVFNLHETVYVGRTVEKYLKKCVKDVLPAPYSTRISRALPVAVETIITKKKIVLLHPEEHKDIRQKRFTNKTLYFTL